MLLPSTPGPAESPYRAASANMSTLIEAPAPPPRGPVRYPALIVAVVMFVCFGTTIAACATDVFTLNVNNGYIESNLWDSTTCVNGVGCDTSDFPAASWCKEKSVRFEFLQAWSILITIVNLAAIVLAAAEAKWLIAAPSTAGILFVFWLMVLVQWGCIAGAYHLNYCSASSLHSLGFKLSSSFALYLMTWIITTIVSMIYAYMHVVSKVV